MQPIKRASARAIIEKNVAFAMGAGLVPIPIVDLGALLTIQIKMVQSLARVYQIDSDQRRLRPIILSLLKSPGISTWAVGGLASLAKLMPGVGSVVGAGTMAIVIGGLTYATGRVFALHFERNGTLADFNLKSQSKIYRREFTSGKKLVKSMKAAAKPDEANEDPFAEINIYLILKPKLGPNGKVYLKTYYQGKRPEKYIGTMRALEERYQTKDLSAKEEAIVEDFRATFIDYLKERSATDGKKA